jgi:chemotaxis family two-component system response regulator Rcp1
VGVPGWLSHRKSRILIIDDNEADLYLIREALRREGLDCDILSITDGAEAIAFLCGPASETNCPDFIVLDINLPKVGGDQVLKAIRKHAPTADVPILVWSSSLRTETDGLKDLSGPAIFMEKPTDLREFLGIGARIRSLLGGTGA